MGERHGENRGKDVRAVPMPIPQQLEPHRTGR